MTDHITVGPKTDLPCPRLELRWIMTGENWFTRECVYSLVIPMRPYDCRAQSDDNIVDVETERFIELGRTKVSGGNGNPPIHEWGIDTPYRDGVHIQWDNSHLNLPMIVVCGDEVRGFGRNGGQKPLSRPEVLKTADDEVFLELTPVKDVSRDE